MKRGIFRSPEIWSGLFAMAQMPALPQIILLPNLNPRLALTGFS